MPTVRTDGVSGKTLHSAHPVLTRAVQRVEHNSERSERAVQIQCGALHYTPSRTRQPVLACPSTAPTCPAARPRRLRRSVGRRWWRHDSSSPPPAPTAASVNKLRRSDNTVSAACATVTTAAEATTRGATAAGSVGRLCRRRFLVPPCPGCTFLPPPTRPTSRNWPSSEVCIVGSTRFLLCACLSSVPGRVLAWSADGSYANAMRTLSS